MINEDMTYNGDCVIEELKQLLALVAMYDKAIDPTVKAQLDACIKNIIELSKKNK